MVDIRSEDHVEARDGAGAPRLLEGQIDVTREPFTDHWSRLLLLDESGSLAVRLVERRSGHGLADDHRLPLAIADLRPTNGDGVAIPYTTKARPDRLALHTPAGEFTAAFVDAESVVFRLPPGAGLSFRAAGSNA